MLGLPLPLFVFVRSLMTPLLPSSTYVLFEWPLIYFQWKEAIKVQIGWNFTWAVGSLKFCTLVGSFCKSYKVSTKKNTEDLLLMTLKNDAKFKEKLACGFKCDMRNLMNFHPTTQKPKNVPLMCYFCRKYMRFELKKYRGVIFHDTGQWCKVWINPDLVVSKIAWGIGWTFIRAPKVWKIVHWWALFVQSI